MEWKDIESAPKDGSVVYVRRVHDGQIIFEGDAVWRTFTFPSFINGIHGVEPADEFTGWMYPDEDKRVPTPTHYRA